MFSVVAVPPRARGVGSGLRDAELRRRRHRGHVAEAVEARVADAGDRDPAAQPETVIRAGGEGRDAAVSACADGDRARVGAVGAIDDDGRDEAGRLVVLVVVVAGVVAAPRHEHLLVVRADGVDPEQPRARLKGEGERIAKAARPDQVGVRPGAVDVRIVARHAAVGIGAPDLGRERGQVRIDAGAVAVVADRPVELAVRPEARCRRRRDCAPAVGRSGTIVVLLAPTLPLAV